VQQQAEAAQNHENEQLQSIGNIKPDMENMRALNLAVGKLTTIQVTKLLCSVRYVR
jgi:hypothetical protein